MPNLINDIILRQLSTDFASAEGMVIVSMNGLTVRETEDLRESLAESGVRLRMVRNRLARLALEKRGFSVSEELFGGNVGCAWGSTEDAIRVAKVFAMAVRSADPKRKGKLAFRGGVFEGSLLDAPAAAALAELPGKDELRAQLLGLLSGPARALATVLQAPGVSIARVLDARVRSGEVGETPETPAPETPPSA